MAYELVEKQRRTGSKHKVSITKTGTFIFNAVVSKKIETDVGSKSFVKIFVDKENGDKTRIAFRFTKQPETNSYVVTRHKSAASVSAKATLEKIGYKYTSHLSRDASWARRSLDGSRYEVLEIEIGKKYLQ